MPELPEVEITARLLDAALAGTEVESALAPGVNALKTFDPPLSAIEGHKFTWVRRRGKLFVLKLDDGMALVIHLMSAGRLQLFDTRASLRDRTSRLLVRLTDGRELRLREFGTRQRAWVKAIRLSEPEIYAATESFGTILENVVFDPRTRVPDYDSDERTENTRAAYPVDLIPNAILTGVGSHPHNVMFLSADAYGVLPPVARLDEDQIRHYFLAGYTAKVAGTERGVTEPEPIFSTCFAAPFLVLPPERYADMLIERVKRHHVDVWMLNTGWGGGPYERMSIAHTRAIVSAVLNGDLRGVNTHVDPIFGLHIPNRVPGVPREVLDTRDSWPDPDDYDRSAAKLRGMFEENISNIGKSASSAG